MANWKNVLLKFTADAERRMDELRYRLYYALGGPGPVKIVTYRGYGRPERLFLSGRVLEDKFIPEAEENDNLWENLVYMYRRMESDEVPGARLAVRFQGQEQEIVADEEGHFAAWIEPEQPLAPHRLWHQVEIELLDPIPEAQSLHPIKAVGEVLVPPPTARRVVVSDIDDTVLQSDATHLIKMARHVFLGNAHTRLPFPGVAGLYRALFAGASGSEMNPLFYVSSSPWNLYDLLAQFFHLQDIPIGPVLFLRNWGVNEEEILPLRHGNYKKNTIRRLLDFYSDMPFILIGDSTQEDPEIYADLVREYPERIEAVYIRNVQRNLERPQQIEALAREVVAAGSALVLADDSLAIARHALEMGFISAESLPDVSQEKRKDEEPPTVIEKMLGDTTKPEGRTVRVSREEVEKEGDIEEQVKKAGKEETSAPPSVIVEGEKARDKKKNKPPR